MEKNVCRVCYDKELTIVVIILIVIVFALCVIICKDHMKSQEEQEDFKSTQSCLSTFFVKN